MLKPTLRSERGRAALFGATLFCAALCGATLALAQPAPMPLPVPKDPNRVVKPGDAPLPVLSTSIHGYFVDGELRSVKATPALILQSQAALLQVLERQLPEAQRAAYRKKQQTLLGAGGAPEGDRVWAQALLTAFLLDTVKPVDEPTLRSRNQSLLSAYAKLLGQPLAADDVIAGKLPEWVKNRIVIDRNDLISIFGPIKGLYNYSAQCKAAGVPPPPNWDAKVDVADGTVSPNGWKKQGQLNTNYLTQPGQFPNARTIVYSYVPATAPMGMCIALPIIQDTVNTPKVIDALGIICQGVSTTGNAGTSNSKACFWDNNGDVTLKTNTPYAINGTGFKSPPRLPDDNQCTDCHAGENAFIVHPGTPLQAAKDAFNNSHTPNFASQNNWYSPMVQPTWPINPEPPTYPDGNGLCGSCHTASDAGRLPNVNPFGLGGTPPRDDLFKYCYFLLPNVLTSVVNPAFNPGTMHSFVASNAADVATLYQSCKSLFPFFPATQNDWLQPRTPP
jgi:hypothetical protein